MYLPKLFRCSTIYTYIQDINMLVVKGHGSCNESLESRWSASNVKGLVASQGQPFETVLRQTTERTLLVFSDSLHFLGLILAAHAKFSNYVQTKLGPLIALIVWQRLGQVLLRTTSLSWAATVAARAAENACGYSMNFFQCSSSKQAILITAATWFMVILGEGDIYLFAYPRFFLCRMPWKGNNIISFPFAIAMLPSTCRSFMMLGKTCWYEQIFLSCWQTKRTKGSLLGLLTSGCKSPMWTVWTVGASPNLACSSASKILVPSSYFAGIAFAMLSQKASMMSRSAPVWGACATIKMAFQ